jgi:hypothetical protein
MLIKNGCRLPISLEEAIEEHFDGIFDTSPSIEKCNKLQKALVNLLTSDRLNLKLHEINEILETNFKEV